MLHFLQFMFKQLYRDRIFILLGLVITSIIYFYPYSKSINS